MGPTEVVVTAMLLAAPGGKDGGGPATPGWREIAAAERTYDAETQAAAARAVESLAPDVRQRVRETLEVMARVPPGVAGLQAAHDAMVATMPGLEPPDADFSGEGPNRSVMRQAGELVLYGLVAREARRVAKEAHPEAEATALLRKLTELNGVDETTRGRLKEEARMGLGDALYLRVLQQMERTQKAQKEKKP